MADGRVTHTADFAGEMSQLSAPTAMAPQRGKSAQDCSDPAAECRADYVTVTNGLGQIKIGCDNRFFGKSSYHMLLKEALALKGEYTGENLTDKPYHGFKRREFWTSPPVSIRSCVS
jgi:hypothetical protein